MQQGVSAKILDTAVTERHEQEGAQSLDRAPRHTIDCILAATTASTARSAFAFFYGSAVEFDPLATTFVIIG